MSKLIITTSIAIFIVTIVVFIQFGAFAPPKPLPSIEEQTPITHIATNAPKIGKLDILFIGNSYTYMHSMPHMLASIAKSDPQNAVELNIQSITIGGARLKEHWKDGRAANLLRQKPWDFVILQDQSNWATYEDGVTNNYAYTVRFKALAKESNEKAIIASFKTWPKQKDTHWYINPKTRTFLKSYDYMRRSIDKNTKTIATRTGIDTVPVSDYWLYVLDNKIPVQLYEQDGSHPSIAGSYLNALVFYRYFTMSDLKNVNYTPPYIDPKTVKKLREIAALGNIQ